MIEGAIVGDVSRIGLGRRGGAIGAAAAARLADAVHAGRPEEGRPRLAVLVDRDGHWPADTAPTPAERAEASAQAVHAVATAVLLGTVTVTVLGRCVGSLNGLAMSADVVSLRAGAAYDMSAASLTPGAYAALARRVGAARLNRILLRDGAVPAGELLAAGIADFLHEGETDAEAEALVARMRRRSNGEAATYLARERAMPLDIERVRACARLAVETDRAEAA